MKRTLETLLMSSADLARWESKPPELRERLFLGWSKSEWLFVGVPVVVGTALFFLGGL